MIAGSAQSIAAPGQAEVFGIRNVDAVQQFHENPAVVRQMVNRLLTAMTGNGNPDAAWRSLVKPTDRVLIQTADQGGPLFSTHAAIIDAVKEGLQGAGVQPSAIQVWSGAHHVSDYDPKAVLSVPMEGRLIYGDLLFVRGPEAGNLSPLSHWTKISGTSFDKIINLPVLSSSESCGIAGAIYNVTVRNLDNWRRFVTPPVCGDPYLAELYGNERIRNKVVLNIMDGLIAQYANGPQFEPGYCLHHATLYASRDAFALDAVALRQIDAWRAEAKLRPLEPRGRFLLSGQSMGLGMASEQQIALRMLP